MKTIIDELHEIYKRTVRVEYILGALARAEEQSDTFSPLQPLHIYEMTGALELVRDYQSEIPERLDKLIFELENR